MIDNRSLLENTDNSNLGLERWYFPLYVLQETSKTQLIRSFFLIFFVYPCLVVDYKHFRGDQSGSRQGVGPHQKTSYLLLSPYLFYLSITLRGPPQSWSPVDTKFSWFTSSPDSTV